MSWRVDPFKRKEVAIWLDYGDGSLDPPRSRKRLCRKIQQVVEGDHLCDECRTAMDLCDGVWACPRCGDSYPAEIEEE